MSLEEEIDILRNLQSSRTRLFSQQEYDRLMYLVSILSEIAGSPYDNIASNTTH